MLTITYLLSAILAVAQPGCSDASRIHLPIEDCDADCMAAYEANRAVQPARDYQYSRAVWEGWSIRESRAEGIVRYVTVARAIAVVVTEPPAGWTGSSRELAHLLVTIARHESGFWRGVHDGTLRGAAGEKGLFQVHPSLPEFDECLVGVDLDATISCVEVAARLVTRAKRMCRSIGGTIAIYGSGSGCQPEGAWVEGVAARIDTFDRTFRSRDLEFDAQLAVLLDLESPWEGSSLGGK